MNRATLCFWLCWVFVPARGLSLVAASGSYSSLWYTGLSLQLLLSLWSTGSGHLDSVGVVLGSRAQAQKLWQQPPLLCSIWNLSRPGIKPVSTGSQILYHWATEEVLEPLCKWKQPLSRPPNYCRIGIRGSKSTSIYKIPECLNIGHTNSKL